MDHCCNKTTHRNPNAVLLSAVCALLAMNLVMTWVTWQSPAKAMGEPIGPSPAYPPTAVEKLVIISAQMAETNKRLASMEARLNGELSVKVTEMPKAK